MHVEDKKRFLEAVQDGECPTCGTPTEEMPESVEEVQERLKAHAAELSATTKALRLFVGYEKALQTATQYRGEQESYLAQRQEALEGLNARAVPSRDLKVAQKVYDEGVALQAKYEQAQDDLQASETRVVRLKATFEENERQLAEAQERLDELETPQDPEAHLPVLEQKLADDARAGDTLKAQKAIAGDVKELWEEEKRRLADYQARQAKSLQAKDWIDHLEAIRAVVHRDCLPKVVHQTDLEEIEQDLNQTLEVFDAPFRIEAHDGLSFVARFIDGTGRVQPDTRLSGGQKVMLSIAFRLAVNSHFAAQAGMMVLDEPTANLNEPLIKSLGDVFARLSETSKNRGMQVLVVTHDVRLTGFFDQVIQIQEAP
jgi:DNA repair exonuclease SbcCD ATPase subunit